MTETRGMTIQAVPAYLMRHTGAVVGQQTVRRWIRSGLRGVKLETTYIGGRPYVIASKLEAFFKRVNEIRSTQTTDRPSEAQ